MLTVPTIPDHGGAALFVLSVFRQVCQDLHLDVAEFSQLAIAYSVVWDLAITSGYGKPQQMLASCNYIRAHMRMFLLWNRSGQLVFDLRRLSWEDAKRVISAGFGLHFRHPIDLLGKYHDGNWKGTVQKTYAHFLSLNPEMPGATEELADKLFKMRSKRSPIRISKNCGYWSRYFTVVAQTVGIPAVESHEEVVFLRPHGQFAGGLRRDGITHYFCAFKRANDGKWFFGKNIITQDPAEYGARTPIPGELTLDQFKSLSPAVLYRADIRLMEIVIGETQLGSAETIVFRVQTVNR